MSSIARRDTDRRTRRLGFALSACLMACASSPPQGGGQAGPPAPTASATSTDVETAFLVKDCLAGGFTDTQCGCVAAQAEERLEAPLLTKMASQPSDEEELPGYYDHAELQAIAAWMDEAATACDLPEET